MKKSFLYAAAAVAVLASCSNEDVVTTTPGGVVDDNAPAKIELSVSTRASKAGVTRGTGTVGAVEGQGDNKWAGQSVNVFMFKHETVDLALLDETDPTSVIYNNAKLLTPGNVAAAERGLAYREDGETRYYPLTGTFDFAGYRLDDAVNGDVINDGVDVSVPFEITGSQDVMVAATPAAADVATAEVPEYKIYGAYAARNRVHPELIFKHLLTRLTFNAVAGNENASIDAGIVNVADVDINGLIPADVIDGKVCLGVYIDKIEIWSKTTGELIVACTPESSNEPSIAWTEGQEEQPLTLMQRQAEDVDGNMPLEEMLSVIPYVEADGAIDLGEALLVCPQDEYEIRVSMHQYKPKYEDWYVNETDGEGNKLHEQELDNKYIAYPETSTTTITLPDMLAGQDTRAGYSYAVNLKVWGLEKIKITTTLQPWKDGGSFDFDME